MRAIRPQPVKPLGGPGGQPVLTGPVAGGALGAEERGQAAGEILSMARSFLDPAAPVLNGNDIDRPGALTYTALMVMPPTCPDPLARAPRATTGVVERLYPTPPALQGAIVAILCRDTRAAALSDAQRLTHFPATPLITLSWFHGINAGLVERGPVWRRFPSDLLLAGSHFHPVVTWAPKTGRGGFACLTADTARALFGIDSAALQDRILPADAVLGPDWKPFLTDLRNAPDDAAVLAALETHLAPRWHPVQGRTSTAPTLRQLGRHWVARLAIQAHDWRRQCSPRQVERRIKTLSGRSLRDWQGLVRTEGVFFSARERFDRGEPPDWAALAVEEGFSDQAHLTRAVKRITGFAPGEFSARFIADESFWAYRLWV